MTLAVGVILALIGFVIALPAVAGMPVSLRAKVVLIALYCVTVGLAIWTSSS